MQAENILIIGAGGLGREVAAMLTQTSLSKAYNLLGFVDDNPELKVINGLPLLGDTNWLLSQKDALHCILAIANPAVKRKMAQKLQSCSNLSFPNIIHPSARLHHPDYIELGMGNIICDGTILTTNVKLGNFNIINLACTLGHDCVLGDYCSIMPGVNISGGAHLQNGVYIGTGAKLIKSTLLEDFCTVGAGSVVNTNIAAGKTYVGIPAREIYT